MFNNMMGGFNPFMMQGMGAGGMNNQAETVILPDTSEQVKVSGLALLKMLQHSRRGIPFEVMGVMLGEMEDDYTVTCVDVFAMPQIASTVSVESVDPVYQINMMKMLEAVGRKEKLVGWYHSHPGFGCWLSIVDITTQKSFEQQQPRAVAVVIDPVQSVKGRVVMDAFRSIPPHNLMMNSEPRQTTSNEGQLKKPTREAMMRGLNRLFYSMVIHSRTSDETETTMLANLNKKDWSNGLQMGFDRYEDEEADINSCLIKLKEYTKEFTKQINKLAIVEQELDYIGKKHIKKHIEEECENLNLISIQSCLSTMVNSVVF